MNSIQCIDKSWYEVLNLLYQQPLKKLNEEILPNISYQPINKEDIFKVFSMPVNKIKVVILGQDPYPTPGNAIGLSFAINQQQIIDKKIPVSLKNIVKETSSENYDLQKWFDQGVFLLNTALTVETGKAGSHLIYWSNFIKRVISFISVKQPCIWLMWGKKAQSFIPYIVKNQKSTIGYDIQTMYNIPISRDFNYILTAPHPAAEAYAGGKAGFFGCNHFKYTNIILEKQKQAKIIW